MIGNYQGSSGAERALKLIVESMVMPRGIEVKLAWPVFGGGDHGRPLLAYQRRDADYELGQQKRLLEVTAVPFDIFIWSENENVVFQIMDALEAGCNAYPLRNGVYALRAQIEAVHDLNSTTMASGAAAAELARLDGLLGDYSPAAQERNLATTNYSMAIVSERVRETGVADWSIELEVLAQIQAQLRFAPAYTIAPLATRDLTASEVWQLGLAGRVFSVEIEYSRG